MRYLWKWYCRMRAVIQFKIQRGEWFLTASILHYLIASTFRKKIWLWEDYSMPAGLDSINHLSYARKRKFYESEKNARPRPKSHKLTAKLSCEYFFIAAESQDYPLSYSRTVPVPDLENKRLQFIKDCNFRKSWNLHFPLIKGFSTWFVFYD